MNPKRAQKRPKETVSVPEARERQGPTSSEPRPTGVSGGLDRATGARAWEGRAQGLRGGETQRPYSLGEWPHTRPGR